MIKKELYLILYFIFIFFHSLSANLFETLPVLYSGRYMPNLVYADQWKENYLPSAPIPSIDLLKKIHFDGLKSIESFKLISLSSDLKKLLQLSEKDLFSYSELSDQFYSNKKAIFYLLSHAFDQKSKNISKASTVELSNLAEGLIVKSSENGFIIVKTPKNSPWNICKKNSLIMTNEYDKDLKAEIFNLHQLLNYLSSLDMTKDPYEVKCDQLIKNQVTPELIKKILNEEFPIQLRLSSLTTFLALPSLLNKENWISLSALKLKVYDEKTNSLIPIFNFTSFNDELFHHIQENYLKLNSNSETERLSSLLLQGYSTLEDKVINEFHKKQRIFPSIFKIKIEYWMHHFNFVIFFLICYSICLIILLMKYPKLKWVSFILIFFTWSLHTLFLCLRSYILSRPPVANMAETLIFVPWTTLTISILLSWIYKTKTPLMGATIGSILLFFILFVNQLSTRLENVQAVLDSQFWLAIHVLMVVGSYGVFILSGILGHFYLILARFYPKKLIFMKLGILIKQSIYLGLFLLIPGTILGGVWAAQSWGRFWDWDPKESWAFITCCIYLAWVHAHYFGLIKDAGLAVGSIIGLMAVIFTWYGVNYILGTGLHSYGFGTGGVAYFYMYLLLEIFFLVAIGKKWYPNITLKQKS